MEGAASNGCIGVAGRRKRLVSWIGRLAAGNGEEGGEGILTSFGCAVTGVAEDSSNRTKSKKMRAPRTGDQVVDIDDVVVGRDEDHSKNQEACHGWRPAGKN